MRHTGTVAVPLASALVGAIASASVAWAATHPTATAADSSRSTVVTHPSRQQQQVVIRRDDDGKTRRVVVVSNTATGASTQTSAPATHTTSGASGAVH